MDLRAPLGSKIKDLLMDRVDTGSEGEGGVILGPIMDSLSWGTLLEDRLLVGEWDVESMK